MIVFRQREFSWINTPNDLGPDNSLAVPTWIIKSFEMAGLGEGIYLNHWLYKEVCKSNLKSCSMHSIPFQLPFILGVEEDFSRLPEISPINQGTTEEIMVRFKNYNEFFDYAKKRLINMKLKGETKYQLKFKDMIPNSTYNLIFKTIALTLSGQIGEFVYSDIWTNQYTIENTPVNYFSYKKLNYNQICSLFHDLLIQVLGITNEGIEDLLTVKPY